MARRRRELEESDEKKSTISKIAPGLAVEKREPTFLELLSHHPSSTLYKNHTHSTPNRAPIASQASQYDVVVYMGLILKCREINEKMRH